MLVMAWFFVSKSKANSHLPLVELAPTTLVLHPFTRPLGLREAKIPPTELALSQQIEVYLKLERYDKALEQINTAKLERLGPAMLLIKAQIHAILENFSLAEQSYLMAIAAMPDFARAHADLARLYASHKQSEKARAHAAKAIQLGINSAAIHGLLGYLNLQEHDGWSAISAYQQALSLAPANPKYRQGLLHALMSSGQYKSAMQLVDEMLKDKPEEKTLWLRRANVAMLNQDHAMALASLEVAQRLGSISSSNMYLMGQLHLQLKNYDRAITVFEQGAQSGDLSIAQLEDALDWLIYAEKPTQAERLLQAVSGSQQTLSREERSLRLYYSGVLAIANNKPNKAIKALQKASELNPTHGPSLLELAKLLQSRKQLSSAEILYNRAARIESTRQQALVNKAQLLINQKNYSAALNVLLETYQDFPHLNDLKTNIQAIENILLSQVNDV